MANLPRLSVILTGDSVTRLEKYQDIKLGDKLERTFSLQNDSEIISLDLVNNAKTFIFEGKDFDVTFTMLDANVITYKVSSMFLVEFDPVFVADIDTITITESNDIKRDISVRIYGELVE